MQRFLVAVTCTAPLFWFSNQADGQVETTGDFPPQNPVVKFVFNDDQRWSITAMNKGPLRQGDPTTLTWSVVPDGTPIVPRRDTESDQPSNLISHLDALYGNDWLPMLEAVFDRYSSLSGLSYLYEPHDDQVAISDKDFATGIPGVRADIRIGGHAINRNLAYNYFPENGDMVLDTSDDFLADPARLSNLIAHEHGHGLGLGHVYSSDSRLLMQPFISVDFEGPQFDDILALHRAYGDPFEENGGNDTAETAVPLGRYLRDNNITIGDDAVLTQVVAHQSDFVSIDGINDVDFYSFQLPNSATTSIKLEPMGPTYNQGETVDSQTRFDAASQNDLSLQLFRSGSSFPVASAASGGLGEAESIDRVLLGAGTYLVRIAGRLDAAQMYRLTVGEVIDRLPGDFNSNGELDVNDIQRLIDQTRAGILNLNLDLNSDDILDEKDLRYWVHSLKNTYYGDANLDGEFNSRDLVAVFQSAQYEDNIVGNSTWATGDWNGDGEFTTRDLIAAFQDAGFEQGTRPAVAVPEPSVLTIGLISAACIWWIVRPFPHRMA